MEIGQGQYPTDRRTRVDQDQRPPDIGGPGEVFSDHGDAGSAEKLQPGQVEHDMVATGAAQPLKHDAQLVHGARVQFAAHGDGGRLDTW